MAQIQVIQQSVSQWWSASVTAAIVNIAWVYGTVTVIFAPPALFALLVITRELVQGREMEVKAFVTHTKAYFWVSWRWMLLNLIVIALVNANFAFYDRLPPLLALIMFNLTIALSAIWVIIQFYAVPYLVWQEEPALTVALRNGFFIAMGNPLFTLIVLIFGLAALAVSILLVAPFFLGGATFFAVLANQALKNRLIKYGMVISD